MSDADAEIKADHGPVKEKGSGVKRIPSKAHRSGFKSDPPLDLRPEPPPMAELMANGGRLLITWALKDMPYRDYLQTNHWQTVRERAFTIHGRRCFVCGVTSGIEVHHTTYERRGEEADGDVVPLCRQHHELQHEILRQVTRAQLAQRFNRPI